MARNSSKDLVERMFGDELDTNTALAMGWSRIGQSKKWHDNKPLEHPGPAPKRTLPRFNCDAKTVPMMLKYIEQFSSLQISVSSMGCLVRPDYSGLEFQEIYGDTLPQALARLIVYMHINANGNL